MNELAKAQKDVASRASSKTKITQYIKKIDEFD